MSLLDPAVPRTQALRRLRALVLASVLTLSLAALSSSTSAASRPAVTTTTLAATTTEPPTTTASTGVAQSVSGLMAPGQVPILTRVETVDPVVFVTIDDGNVRSDDAAAAIAELGIPVSLFLLDGPISAGAEYFAGLPGATVESHTRTHPDLRTLSLAGQRREICGNAKTIARAFGRSPVLFRPPYGNYDANTPRAAAECGMVAIVLWEVVVDHDSTRHRTVAQLQPGDIVLFHFVDGLGDSLRAFAQQVQEAGLRIARLEDYLVP